MIGENHLTMREVAEQADAAARELAYKLAELKIDLAEVATEAYAERVLADRLAERLQWLCDDLDQRFGGPPTKPIDDWKKCRDVLAAHAEARR